MAYRLECRRICAAIARRDPKFAEPENLRAIEIAQAHGTEVPHPNADRRQAAQTAQRETQEAYMQFTPPATARRQPRTLESNVQRHSVTHLTTGMRDRNGCNGEPRFEHREFSLSPSEREITASLRHEREDIAGGRLAVMVSHTVNPGHSNQRADKAIGIAWRTSW